eukprot:scaffold7381_cov310-Pinguiococcus_pyrenoidosus.AAC.93
MDASRDNRDDLSRMYRARKTMLKMMKARGYAVDFEEGEADQTTWSLEQFLQHFGDDVSRRQLDFVSGKPDDEEDTIYVGFHEEDKKVSKSTILEYVQKMQELKVRGSDDANDARRKQRAGRDSRACQDRLQLRPLQGGRRAHRHYRAPPRAGAHRPEHEGEEAASGPVQAEARAAAADPARRSGREISWPEALPGGQDHPALGDCSSGGTDDGGKRSGGSVTIGGSRGDWSFAAWPARLLARIWHEADM